MTASIVGWAHTPFGKLDSETVESLIVARRERGARARRRRARRTSTRSCSATSTPASRPGLHRRARAAGRATASASSRRPASRTPARPARPRSIRASRRSTPDGARIVLVVGVEQMTTTPGAEIGHNLLNASYLPEDGDTPGGFAGVFGKIAALLLPAPRRPVRRARADRRQEPQERRRQSLRADAQGPRLRLLPRRVRQESVRRRPAEAHRLLPRLGRRGGAGHRRRRHGGRHGAGSRLPRDRPCAGFPADVEARHPQVRGLRRGVAAGSRGGAASTSTISRSSRRTTASPSPS